jgi:hypothetical protein
MSVRRRFETCNPQANLSGGLLTGEIVCFAGEPCFEATRLGEFRQFLGSDAAFGEVQIPFMGKLTYL